MKRRTFIATSIAAAVAPMALNAAEQIEYKPGMIKALLEEGKTVFVDYGTEWCSTCASQKRTISALRDANPVYDKNIVFVHVDYDAYGNKPVTTSRGIPRRSTLIVLKGDQELGRIVAGTSKKMIKALMDTGLKAAMS